MNGAELYAVNYAPVLNGQPVSKKEYARCAGYRIERCFVPPGKYEGQSSSERKGKVKTQSLEPGIAVLVKDQPITIELN